MPQTLPNEVLNGHCVATEHSQRLPTNNDYSPTYTVTSYWSWLSSLRTVCLSSVSKNSLWMFSRCAIASCKEKSVYIFIWRRNTNLVVVYFIN